MITFFYYYDPENDRLFSNRLIWWMGEVQPQKSISRLMSATEWITDTALLCPIRDMR